MFGWLGEKLPVKRILSSHDFRYKDGGVQGDTVFGLVEETLQSSLADEVFLITANGIA